MKAAVLYGQSDIRYEEIEMPKINDDEILVNVKATGVCGSDIPRVLGDVAHYYPIVLGHEFSGEVVEVGKRVRGISMGDRVTGAPLIPCHRCVDCVQGNYAQCKNYTFIGSRVFGSWAEYVKLPGINGVKLPEGVSYEQGAFFEPATVAFHGLFCMDFRGGSDVAIIGMGTIGLLVLQCARILGAKRIFAFDIDNDKLEVAREYGADICLNTRDEGFQEIIRQETNGRGFELVVEAAGVESTEKLSLEIASNKGKIMFIGTPSRDVSLTRREFENINRKELTIRGSWMSYSAPFPGKEWELTSYYFQKGRLDCDRLVDRVIPLGQISKAFEDLMSGKVKGKILLKP
ncbi:MAG TPA: galactitol-1-phosphate 5-dehydrogenase [Firmicutes bacterium]|nr:galactitol-1-phosphate 5-dehydrogenase [Bacillota bacterium]